MTQPNQRNGSVPPLESQLHKLRKRLARPRADIPETPRDGTSTKADDAAITLWMLFATLRRRLVLVVFIATLCAVAAYYWAQKQPKYYKTTATVEVVAISPKVFTNIREVVNYTFQMRLFYNTQVEILRSLPIYQKAINLHPSFLEDPGFFGLDRIQNKAEQRERMARARSSAASILQSKTTVQLVRRSSLLRISVSDTDPMRAQELASAIVKAYQEHNRLFRLRATLDAYSEIKLRLEEYQTRNKTLQQQIMDFRNKHNILSSSLNDRRNLVFKELEELNQRTLQVMFKRISHESMLGPYLKPKPITQPQRVSFPPLLQNGLFQKLLENYNEITLKQNEARARYRPKHPEMQKLDRHAQYIHETLVQQIQQVLSTYRSQYLALAREESFLRKKTNVAKQRLQGLDRLNLNLDDLRTQQTALNDSLRFLNKRYFELQLLKDSTTSNVHLIEPPPQPKTPFSPRVFRTTIISGVFSFIALFGLFFLIELLDRSVRSLGDIEEKQDLPPSEKFHCSSIKKPSKKTKKNPFTIPINPLPRSKKQSAPLEPTSSSWLPINASYAYSSQVPSPREGKTFVATNTAISIAHAGKRTILIDTDMRRPRVHKILDVDYDRSKGASSVIVGQHTLQEAMFQSDYPNLWILPCGPIPPSPTELLQTEGFHKLFRELEDHFDAILFDTPPILSVTDAAVLSAYVDGCILISSSGSTTWNALRAARQKLESVGGRILGCILNKISDRDRTYAYQRGYYYGTYRYNYYGESSEES